mmetsp:Transcript_102060/g.304573  ORF Transcript_102060/g.304573 Transcript_102060/m.304573 type:complete len:228 (+) Transcript_102060:751-1434(+)
MPVGDRLHACHPGRPRETPAHHLRPAFGGGERGQKIGTRPLRSHTAQIGAFVPRPVAAPGVGTAGTLAGAGTAAHRGNGELRDESLAHERVDLVLHVLRDVTAAGFNAPIELLPMCVLHVPLGPGTILVHVPMEHHRRKHDLVQRIGARQVRLEFQASKLLGQVQLRGAARGACAVRLCGLPLGPGAADGFLEHPLVLPPPDSGDSMHQAVDLLQVIRELEHVENLD